MGIIIWSKRAKEERAKVLKYWNQRNGNNLYSQKLNAEIQKTIKLLKGNPFIGNEIDFFDGIRRILIFSNYAIFYTMVDDAIYIFSFGDNLQNPNEINLR